VPVPVLVASANGSVGMDAGWEVLAGGGSALDAVEVAARMVEDEPTDHTVGYGGYPNLLGEVELDASIMEGTTRRAGAVGSLRRYRAAITVARAVMERLPHVLVVGDGAARLAEEIGLEPEDLLTEEAERVWRAGLDGNLPEDSVGGRMLSLVASLATDPERAAGTVNFLAIDGRGRMASAVSTSGWAWKYPGRLGDTPVIGAGNYCDDRYGAAACTGFGELSIRAGTARTVVASLAAGHAVERAAHESVRDLFTLGMPTEQVIMHLVAVDRDGNHAAVSTRPGRTYVHRSAGMASYEESPRLVVDAAGRAPS
jgi:beta-aspartyl-peptidase (threonine type)